MSKITIGLKIQLWKITIGLKIQLSKITIGLKIQLSKIITAIKFTTIPCKPLRNNWHATIKMKGHLKKFPENCPWSKFM